MAVNDIFLRLIEPQPWMADAACKGMDTDRIFFPKRGDNGAAAKAVCNTCPVKIDCQQYAADGYERFGIWGGMSANNTWRQRTTKPRKPVVRELKPIAHGTLAGYQQERRRGVDICDECRQARIDWRHNKRNRGQVA